MKTKTITINGMHCGSCVKLIKDEFAKIETIHSVDIDLGKKEAVIEYSSDELDLHELDTLIQPFGFSIIDKKKLNLN
ncbi:MAG: hypothetical protein A2015_11035 [Spirochaetes bacterium GWF1_31_7]|nr:MAG: hypothetical protein A2Y30_13170 [Spirochaetes bacterium GWE1_32_154]OHD48392.1 MAG: hypothetical protein A2015_11035 [Spirochaetes bacterium GWF1_31_7]OHD50485.1 MAG: hypothetical protein A2Y29_11215 [Spirochaetes bacterium GWE2_31_10]OHD82292.1 MAG: hypothetical protein A2355_00905 [Spirochaetes bacterium RIFOXYB1_FULL_32_8]HBD93244.1 hypothetical protein [Spirochaetia bacterium]